MCSNNGGKKMYKYIVEKYSGKVYCGNAFFNTLDECLEFANDGFCDKAIITNCETKEKIKTEV